MRAGAVSAGRCLVVPGFVLPPPPLAGVGSLTQDELYGDEDAAQLFLAYEADSRYQAIGDVLPVAEAAEQIVARRARCTLDVIALGPGAARREVALVQRLVLSPQFAAVRLFLLDLAQPIAWQAHPYAADELSAYPCVFVLGLQGDMHSARDREADLPKAPLPGRDRWDTETWPGIGPARSMESFDVPIGGRTLLEIEKDVAVRMLEAHGGDRCGTAAHLEIEPQRLANLLDPPPGGAVLPWDLPSVHEVLALVREGCHG